MIIKIKGAQIIMEVLKDEGVKTIFGFQGELSSISMMNWSRRISNTFSFATSRGPSTQRTVMRGHPAKSVSAS